ncbi:MAG: hypothetical protein ACTS73_04960 [Arsenophonus sp. NEOnobi-MAG3]
MISIHALKQLISLCPPNILTVNILSAVDIHYGYSDIVAKSPIAGKHLTILVEVLWRNYITRITTLVILDLS